MKRVSLAAIAKEVGLSKTTVSMVLNGKGDIYKLNSETQKRVLEVAKKYRFTPNKSARNLSNGNSMTLGLIVPSIVDSHFSQIAEIIEKISSKFGYQVLLGTTNGDPKKEKELLLKFEAEYVDGILIASTQQNLLDIQAVYNSGLPIVLFDRHYPGTNLPHVIVDNYIGSLKLVEYLIANNHKSIGYVGLDLELSAIHERKNGFNDAIKKYKVKNSEMKIVEQAKYKTQCPMAVEELLIGKNISALVFETHYLALYGIGKINELGLNYPGNVTLVSFGDHEVFSIFRPEVTALVQPAKKIADSAMKILFNLITRQESDSLPESIIEAPELIVRNT